MSQAASERQHVSVDHPTLGKVTGLQVEPTVTQFRGIKYATVNERFAECVIHEQKDIDATNWGPSCPQPADGFPNEQMFIQQGLPADSVPDDELNCLNLNITTPKGAAGSANPLPVLVFVHGGGLFVGADSWPHYDQAKLVALAASRGRPIVAVNLNYRLGAVGWLASPKEGLKGNFGANDVITAFEWIHKHISGFGGDPNNITALGNSAGSSIVTALLYQDKPLFKKIIPAGGTALLGPFADAKTQEEKFNALAGMLGIDATRKAFEKVSVEDLTQKTPMMYLGLGVDGDLFKEAQTSTLVAQKKESWCEEIFIGNNEHDASIMIMGLLGKLDKVSKQLPGYLKQALPEFADDIINTYKVSEDMSQAEALEAITSLATDVFAVATQKYLIGWPNEKRYFYRFAVPNPWDGPLKGFATHILEVAFLFQNYNHVLSEENRQIAEKLAESIIGFMYDVPPCKPWTENPEGREDLAFGSLRSGDARKEKILEIADKVGYEKLSGVMMGFYFGP